MNKQVYESPVTEVVEVKMNGVLCESPMDVSIILLATERDSSYPTWAGESI